MRCGWSGTSTVRPSSSVTRREAKAGELYARTKKRRNTWVPSLKRSGIDAPHGHPVRKVLNHVESTGILCQSENVLVFHAQRIGERDANASAPGMGWDGKFLIQRSVARGSRSRICSQESPCQQPKCISRRPGRI